MIASGVASINNLHRDCRTRAHAIAVYVRTAGGEFVALATGAATVGLVRGVDGAAEELLVHGCVVETGAAGPLPGGLAAVASGAHPAVILCSPSSAMLSPLYQIRRDRQYSRLELTEVEATPSNPAGALTVVQSPIVAGVEVPPVDAVWPPDGSCATLFDAPPT